jgi:hypothetical protein
VRRRGKAVVAMLTSQVVVPWLLSGVEVGVVVTIVVQPPLHYLPLALAVTGAANAASTLLNLFLTRTNLPLLNVSNPPTFCYHSNRYWWVGATPDAALTENREDIDIFLAVENLKYR